ncbi:MAG TPA: discoidin domain-containing protein [Candidatus Polarisedimenticolaceae bacterium]|nr:discoidin domain-containing protein [Candidatus Polarisedimenticolaceae bacterium]
MSARTWLRRFAPPALLPLLIVPLVAGTAAAQENLRSPATLVSFSVGQPVKGMADVSIEVDVLAPGSATLDLDVPKDVGIVAKDMQSSFATPARIKATWSVALPAKGEYFLQALLRVPQDAPIATREFVGFQTFALYVEMDQGSIRWQDNAPNPKLKEPLRILDRKEFSKSSAAPVRSDPKDTVVRIQQKTITQPGSLASYDIYVYIAGRIQFPQGDGPCAGDPYQGVPNSRVYLDWDYDHDTTTGYTPYFADNIRHAGYDDTAMDGSYYFYFHFTSSVPASAYSDIIRVYAGKYNGHAYNGDDVGLYFPSYYYVNIAQAVDSISDGAANVNVWAPDGGALRYLYRVRLFCSAEMGWSTSNQNRYYIRESASTSYFCGAGSGCPGGPSPGVPYILFNYTPNADLAYHEQGHFVDWYNQYHIPTDGGAHWFELSTTQKTAWVEGWAEFYNAAAQLYWAGVEQPAYIEYSNVYGKEYQFLEDTQSILPTGVDRKTVEGAIASFAFNLYDKVSPRHPGYRGDNDNIGASGSTILSAWNAAEFDSCNVQTSLCTNMVAAFNSRMQSALGSRWAPSVQAMYNYFIGASSSPPYSATPSTVAVSGSDLARTLTWSDDTSPASVPYSCYTVYPDQNNESGFHVYRKAGGGTWDGTLTGYTLVGTTGSNVTTFSHTLNDRTAQSYVVVAYNATGESVPLAQAVWPEAPAPAITGPPGIATGVTASWNGAASGGTAPYAFRWYTGPYSCQGTWTLRSTSATFSTSATSDFCIKLEAQGANGSTGTATLPVDVGYVDCGSGCADLALGKPVSDSGLWDPTNSPATKLNDNNTGTTSTCEGAQGYCAIACDPGHAQAVGNFFQIDLGELKSVNSVIVYGRRDTALTQAQNLKLRLSRDGVSWFDYFMADTTSPSGLTVPTGRLARYVKVETTTVVYLSLYEVKVMGPSTCGNGICEPDEGEWCDSCPQDCQYTTVNIPRNQCVICDRTGETRCGPGMSLWCCY